jgi:hypothetical protein
MKKWAFLILAGRCSGQGGVVWRCGKSAPKDGHALEFIYDTGSRELEEKNNGALIKS